MELYTALALCCLLPAASGARAADPAPGALLIDPKVRFTDPPEALAPRRNGQADSEGTLDALTQVCCSTGRGGAPAHASNFFNEADDERSLRYPARASFAGSFPPAGAEPGHPGAAGFGGAFDERNEGDSRESAAGRRGVLVGPGGPTGASRPGVGARGVLVGPGGPTGFIGPERRGILVGPGGFTGIVGPPGGRGGFGGPRRRVLVGPGGPTGIIGPARPFR